MEDFDLLDYEMQLFLKQQAHTISKPMVNVDKNWQALKEERNTPLPVAMPKIERVSNVSLVLWANKNYTDGNLTCDVYRNKIKEPYKKNLIFEVKPELTPRQFKVWDLIMTDALLNDCQPKRVKFYEKDHAEDYSAEFAHFEIWKNGRMLWACLLIEDWLLPMNIILDEFEESGNYRLTCAWKNRIAIDDWYKDNI
jgi:hypothetical protein